MKKYDVEQGSPEWFAARLGIPTASEFDKIISPTGLASKQCDAYANQLLAEMIVGESVETWDGSAWTQRGKELEPDAVLFYESLNNIKTEVVGFCTDDARTMGCSPDRLIGKEGMLEVKVLSPRNHVAYMMNPTVDRDHYPQLMGQLLVTGRNWVDIISYHPKMQPVIIRVERDNDYLFTMTQLLAKFTKLLKEKKQSLINKGFYTEEL